MKISVKVKPKSKTAKVEKIGENEFRVCVREAASAGKANQAILKALADYFEIALSRLEIISGQTSHRKIIKID